MEKRHNHRPDPTTPSSEPVMGEPVDAWDQVNKYGTYECQDTTETDNVFPLIGPLGMGATGILPADVFPDTDNAPDEPDRDRRKD